MRFLGGKGGYFEKLSYGSETSDMTSEGLGEVFKGDSADTCTGKFPLVSMGGRANGQACADGERGPPSARAEFFLPSSYIPVLIVQFVIFSFFFRMYHGQ
jgi:hypothetical protein